MHSAELLCSFITFWYSLFRRWSSHRVLYNADNWLLWETRNLDLPQECQALYKSIWQSFLQSVTKGCSSEGWKLDTETGNNQSDFLQMEPVIIYMPTIYINWLTKSTLIPPKTAPRSEILVPVEGTPVRQRIKSPVMRGWKRNWDLRDTFLWSSGVRDQVLICILCALLIHSIVTDATSGCVMIDFPRRVCTSYSP